MSITRLSTAINFSSFNFPKKTVPVHQFNLNKWKVRGIFENVFFAKFTVYSSQILDKKIEQIKIGDTVEINGKIKHVIGFNGSVTKDSIETKSGELFYGNRFVAEKYAVNRARTGQESYLRALLADSLPRDEHHTEAWFKGNWMPLSPAALQELNVEAIPIKKFELQFSKDIISDPTLFE